MEDNYYEILGVAETATTDEIIKAFRKLAKQLHPDVCKSPDAHKKFIWIAEAYEILKSPEVRKKYDVFREENHVKEYNNPFSNYQQEARRSAEAYAAASLEIILNSIISAAVGVVTTYLELSNILKEKEKNTKWNKLDGLQKLCRFIELPILFLAGVYVLALMDPLSFQEFQDSGIYVTMNYILVLFYLLPGFLLGVFSLFYCNFSMLIKSIVIIQISYLFNSKIQFYKRLPKLIKTYSTLSIQCSYNKRNDFKPTMNRMFYKSYFFMMCLARNILSYIILLIMSYPLTWLMSSVIFILGLIILCMWQLISPLMNKFHSERASLNHQL